MAGDPLIVDAGALYAQADADQPQHAPIRRDHVVVTRNGRPAAVMVPIDEYQALEETAEILSDRDALAAIETGLAEIERGETVTFEELRQELAELRAGPCWEPA
jgi:PHD/YefM family antitoxin component YafN of YafNO toxin-antitoxin module